jgi:hypothetical protein
MNTAPVTAPVVSREIAPGVTVNSGMSPTQIFQAHLKANVSTQFHTDGTAMKLAQVDGAPGGIAGKAPPPTPKALEAANKPQGTPSASRQAEFDAEMQAKGLQRRPDGSTHADGEVDHDSIAKLTESYKYWHARRDTQAERQELRERYERDLRRIHNGRPLSELELNISTGEVVAIMKGSKEVKPRETAPAAPVSRFTPAQWVEGHKSVVNQHGMMPLDRINKAGLSGYTLPKYLPDQHYSPEIFALLQDARGEGLTQKMVDGMIKAEMVRTGWLKA